MIHYPVIKAKYHVVQVPDEGVYLMSENEKHILEGDTMLQVVPLLNGQRTWADIVAQLAPVLGQEAVSYGIDLLLQNGHVEESASEAWRAFQIYWTELGLTGEAATRLLQTTNVHVQPLGQVDPRGVLQGLAAFGFPCDPHRPASITLALVDDYEHPGLATLNVHMLAHGAPWLLMKANGLTPLVGPFFRPGQGPCWLCLSAWLGQNREVETYLRRKTGATAPLPMTKARVPLGETQAISIGLLQMARWLARAESPLLDGQVLAIDTLSGAQSSHPVTRRPQCTACGDPACAQVAGRPVVLNDPQQRVANENGFRPEAPETTFARYAHLISPLTGVVKAVYPAYQAEPSPIHTYMAGHNFALKNDSIYFLKDGLRSSSSGKGRTDAQARTSALCEALERFSGIFRGEQECVISSYLHLGDAAVDPRSIMLYSDAQYANLTEWNARGARFQVVPLPFDETAPISWSPIWSWTGRCRKYIPTSQAYYGFRDSDDKFFAWADSNGCAAGGNLEDALLQGALEVVERDCVGIWWMNRLTRPAVDLDSFDDDCIRELQAYYAARHREMWVLDLTNDLNIPCFAAINRRKGGPTEDIIMGFGAHFDPRIALSRATTEMNQFIGAVLNVGEDGKTIYAYDDQEALAWWQTATIENQPYLVPAKGTPSTLEEIAIAPEGSVKENVLRVFTQFEALGHEVLILDQTQPDLGLPVVKVIVPGLRHFWARYAPGRLYDVPVRMGWRETPLAETELNPIAMFI